MDKDTTEEVRSTEVANEPLEMGGEASWMHGKSQMLDEVITIAFAALLHTHHVLELVILLLRG